MNPHRLIPNEIRGRNTLIGNLPVVGDVVGDASAKDLLFAVVIPLFASMFVVGSLPEQYSQYGIYIMFGVIAIGFSILAAIPNYTSFSGLVTQFYSFHKTANERRPIPVGENDEKVEHRMWETSESTVEKTGVERIFGDKGVIERDDEVIVGAMKVRGMNLDTATQGSVSTATQQFANFVNNNLEFPIQIYLTTRRFNPDQFLDKYESRLDDPEIQDNDLIEMYIDHYIDRTPRFLSQYYYREYYILVPVTRYDVRKRSREQGALDLTAIPGGVGELLAEIFGGSDVGQITEDQIRQRQINEAKKRLEKVRTNGIESLGDAEAEVIDDANHYAALIKEFWEGRDLAFKRDEQFLRETPLVTGKPDRDKMETGQGVSASELQ